MVWCARVQGVLARRGTATGAYDACMSKQQWHDPVRRRGLVKSRRHRFAAVPGVVIGALFAGAIVVAQATHSSSDGVVLPGELQWFGSAAQPDPRSVAATAAQEVLSQRAQAVMAQDAAAWSARLDASTPKFAAEQEVIFENMSGIPFAHYEYDISGVEMVQPVSAEQIAAWGVDEAWMVPTILRYSFADASGQRLAGYVDVARAESTTMVRRGDQWWLAAPLREPQRAELWEQGPVSVVRGQRCLVLGAAGGTDVGKLAGLFDQGAAAVDEVWGSDWPRTALVVVPQTQNAMAQLLGRTSDAGLDQVAAVTTGVAGAGPAGAGTTGDRIVVNPTAFEMLQGEGQLTVVTHELTHIATRVASVTGVPMWLSEGFADYVAYKATSMQGELVAGPAVAAYRRQELAQTLPPKKSFDPKAGDIAPAYSASWVATSLLADRFGEEVLVALYHDIADQAAKESRYLSTDSEAQERRTEQALQEHLGMGISEFTQLWWAELQEYAEAR